MITILAGAILAAGGYAPDLSISKTGSTSTLRFDNGLAFRTTRAAVLNAQMVEIPGSPVRVATWEERIGKAAQSYYAISLDGRTVNRTTPTDYDIELQYASFDPAVSRPAVPENLKSRESNELFLVQFAVQPLDEFRDAVESAGGTIYHFVTNHSYIVRLDSDSKSRVENLPFVRAVAPYEPAYRTDRNVRARLAAGTLPAQQGYNIQLMSESPAMMDEVVAAIGLMGGEVTRSIPANAFLTAKLTPAQVVELLHNNNVSFLDVWSAPEQDMNLLRQLDGVDYVNGFANFDGTGLKIAVMDGGFQAAHIAFLPRTLEWQTAAATDSHGTACLGINIGDGDGNALGKGVLPAANGVVATYSSYLNMGGNRDLLTSNLLSQYQAVYQSNSWGDARVTTYTAISAQMDSILYNHDIVILQSQSNAGNTMSRPQAWAKNIVSVGGAYHFDNTNWADDRHNFGASTGPAADGRVKPELCNAYDAGITTYTTTTNGYANFSGTSQATPVTAGIFGIMYQMWGRGYFGNVCLGTTLFANRPKAQLAKALMINTARMYDAANVDTNRNVQGWGVPQANNLWDRRNDMFWVNETDVLTNLQSKSYRLYVAAGTPQLKVTMGYLDPAGTVGAAVARKNNLSLRVTSPSGTQYWGNFGMSGFQNTTLPGGSENNVDTVENVFVNAPAAGTWIVEVIGSDINTDARVETPGTIDADFALVATGVSFSLAPTSFTTSPTTLVSGGLNELARSDNTRVVQQESSAGDVIGSQRTITLFATSPVATLSRIGYLSELKSDLPTCRAKFLFWNFSTNSWTEVSDSALGTADSAFSGGITTNASQYVNPADRQMRLRIEFRNTDLTTDSFWLAHTDLVRFHVNP